MAINKGTASQPLSVKNTQSQDSPAATPTRNSSRAKKAPCHFNDYDLNSSQKKRPTNSNLTSGSKKTKASQSIEKASSARKGIANTNEDAKDLENCKKNLGSILEEEEFDDEDEEERPPPLKEKNANIFLAKSVDALSIPPSPAASKLPTQQTVKLSEEPQGAGAPAEKWQEEEREEQGKTPEAAKTPAHATEKDTPHTSGNIKWALLFDICTKAVIAHAVAPLDSYDRVRFRSEFYLGAEEYLGGAAGQYQRRVEPNFWKYVIVLMKKIVKSELANIGTEMEDEKTPRGSERKDAEGRNRLRKTFLLFRNRWSGKNPLDNDTKEQLREDIRQFKSLFSLSKSIIENAANPNDDGSKGNGAKGHSLSGNYDAELDDHMSQVRSQMCVFLDGGQWCNPWDEDDDIGHRIRPIGRGWPQPMTVEENKNLQQHTEEEKRRILNERDEKRKSIAGNIAKPTTNADTNPTASFIKTTSDVAADTNADVIVIGEGDGKGDLTTPVIREALEKFQKGEADVAWLKLAEEYTKEIRPQDPGHSTWEWYLNLYVKPEADMQEISIPYATMPLYCKNLDDEKPTTKKQTVARVMAKQPKAQGGSTRRQSDLEQVHKAADNAMDAIKSTQEAADKRRQEDMQYKHEELSFKQQQLLMDQKWQQQRLLAEEKAEERRAEVALAEQKAAERREEFERVRFLAEQKAEERREEFKRERFLAEQKAEERRAELDKQQLQFQQQMMSQRGYYDGYPSAGYPPRHPPSTGYPYHGFPPPAFPPQGFPQQRGFPPQDDSAPQQNCSTPRSAANQEQVPPESATLGPSQEAPQP